MVDRLLKEVYQVEGDDWQRHRKLTAPSFNETTSSGVWDEAQRQACDMLRLWTEKGPEGTRDTVLDTATLTLHVLTGAGFGVFYSYAKGVSSPPTGHEVSYRDALLKVLQNVVLLTILPQRWTSSPYAPTKLQYLGRAIKEFRTYMSEMLADQRRLMAKQEATPRTLLSALVRASEEAENSGTDAGPLRGLTDEEMYGNMFVFNLAGYETTANTISTGIVLLAAYPEWQEWISDEINCVLDDDEKSPSWQYANAFTKLPRCLAVMVSVPTFLGPSSSTFPIRC